MASQNTLVRITAASTLLLALCGGCEDRNGTSRTTNPPPAPDNTARNTRDRDGTTQTPLDQGENETDRRITSEVRKAIMADSSMSVNAQNAKVITKNGVVTLRGPVDSDAEKAAVEAKATAVAGAMGVVNELEVKNR